MVKSGNGGSSDMVSILVVEDSHVQAEALKYTLEQEGYDVAVANDGKQALEMSRERRFTLVISDILMPVMDGYELCSVLKSDSLRKDIPVLLLTQLSDPRDIIRGLQTGADSFITKPYSDEYLIIRIKHLLANAELRKQGTGELPHSIIFRGEKYEINPEKQQVLDLLISVFETALEKNNDLISANENQRKLIEQLTLKKDELARAHEEVRRNNELLEKRVKERTADLKKEQEILLNARNFLDSIIEQSPFPTWISDEEGTLIRLNRACYEMLNIVPEEVVGSYNILEDNIVLESGMMPLVRSVYDDGKSVNFDLHYDTMQLKSVRLEHHADVFINVTIFPVRDNTGKITNAVIQESDIASRRLYEQELKLRSAAMNNAANAIIITDRGGIIQYVNPAFEKLGGYSFGEVIGKTPWKLIKSDKNEDSLYRGLWAKVTAGEVWTGEIINRRKDDSIYTGEMTIAPVKTDDGEVQYYVAVMQDITERKLASDLLNARLNLVSFSAQNSLEALMTRTLDEVERFTESSIGFFHFLDEDQKTVTLQAWSTKTLNDYCKAEDRSLHYGLEQAGIWADCLQERKAVVHNDYASVPHRKGLPEGHAPLIREILIPIIKNDLVVAILGVGNKATDYNERDISVATYMADILWGIIERKRGEENLKNLNTELESRVAERTADLEKANRELESFSYSISHDLRAPLRHISGFTEMLKHELEDSSGEKALHYMEVIDDSVRSMGKLIDDLLAFSRMGRNEMLKKPVNMESVVDEVVAAFTGEMKMQDVTLVRSPLPAAQGDRAMLAVVFANLLSNAIKFTSKSDKPRIEIGYMEKDGEPVYYVRDNGAGFDIRYADKLFGVFQRLHSDRDFEGTGIGLATVKRIVERHGGRIMADGKPGEGACFWFSLSGEDSTG